MTTSGKSILLQRALRAEAGRRIAENESRMLREALHDAHETIRRLKGEQAVSTRVEDANV